jgi:hypothetical protein
MTRAGVQKYDPGRPQLYSDECANSPDGRRRSPAVRGAGSSGGRLGNAAHRPDPSLGTLYGFNTSAPGAASSSQALTVMASIT